MIEKLNLPKHIAFILDGNRRWAKENNTSMICGHKAGFKSIRNIVEYCIDTDIEYISLFAFSTENWNRPQIEIDHLMKLFYDVIKKEVAEIISNKIKFVHIGRKDRLPSNLLKLIKETENKSFKNDKLTVYLALDYGGRDEIIRAINRIRDKNEELTEETLEQYLDLPKPYPDLLIRTSNERRTSNFLIWELAYCEYIFIDKYLPDYTVEDFKRSLIEYGDRERRYGK